jgi:hypothetical protein
MQTLLYAAMKRIRSLEYLYLESTSSKIGKVSNYFSISLFTYMNTYTYEEDVILQYL